MFIDIIANNNNILELYGYIYRGRSRKRNDEQ